MWTRDGRARGVAVLLRRAAPPALLLGVLVLLPVACSSAPGGEATPSASRPVETTTCTVSAGTPQAAAEALDGAAAGWTICVTADLVDTDLRLERSGTADQPIRLVAEGATVRSVTVADEAHVVVEGFVTEDGEGIVLSGRDLEVRGNEVRDAAFDGISCADPCVDVVVADNTVVGADGSGILVEGERITVRDNTVSGSVRRESGDADGIRFFGTDVRILGNTVTDITDEGYDSDPPHTDCFQTYDNSRPPTVGAVVSGNVCRDVDHQCLIATAEEAGTSGQLGRSRDIEFTGNVCDVGGSQAVLVQWIPDVVVRSNILTGPDLDRAAIFLDGSTGAEFFDNEVPGEVAPYQLDEESEEGFSTDEPN